MLSQILSVVIFVVMFVEIVREKFPRHLVTLVAGALTLVGVFLLSMQSLPAVLEALSLQSMAETTFWYTGHTAVNEMNTGINWSTIIFISGMMIMVEDMSEAGFFDWLCLRLAKLVNYRPIPLLVCFMILSAVLSMFIDSITVILFLAVASVRLAHLLHFDPIPLIIAEIFTANLGGAATMSGDPPNIIIGTSLGLSFWDFLKNNGVICLVGLAVVLVYFYFCFRNKLKQGYTADPALWDINPADAIPNRRAFVHSVTVFGVVLLLIATHTVTGLTMPTIGCIAAVFALLGVRYPRSVLKRVDWQTIGFILGLFLTVSGLEQTGVLEGLAQGLAALGGDSPERMVVLLIWFTAITSAFVDNIPMATVMVPVLQSLSSTLGMDLHTLTWAVSKGTDIGGIATPVGASANVAGVTMAAREGHPIPWKRYCKYAVPAVLLVLVLSMLLLLNLH